MNTDAKFSAKYKQTELKDPLKGLYTMTKCDLSLGCRDGLKYANKQMWYATLIEWKVSNNYMIISIDAERSFDKILHPLMIKKKISTDWV